MESSKQRKKSKKKADGTGAGGGLEEGEGAHGSGGGTRAGELDGVLSKCFCCCCCCCRYCPSSGLALVCAIPEDIDDDVCCRVYVCVWSHYIYVL